MGGGKGVGGGEGMVTQREIRTVPDPVGMRWRELLREAARALEQAGIEGGMRDARRLLMAVLDIPAERVALIADDCPQEERIDAFHAAVARRRAREPLSHIVGHRAFYGHRFSVNAHVLDPRPETEHVVEQALEYPFRRVLDLGTGSGCILLSLLCARPFAHGVGADLSLRALEVARGNADALGLSDRARFVLSDWFAQLRGPFDLVVSNPPYISRRDMAALPPEVAQYEPEQALCGGADGLDAYRAITAGAGRVLAPGGRLIVEIGRGQAPAVCALFAAAGLEDIAVQRDLSGHDRVVSGRRRAADAPAPA